MPLPYQRARNAIAEGCVERDMIVDGEGGPTYRIHFAVTYGGCPARISGPPEDCYPAEGPEWEIVEVEEEDFNGDGDWISIDQTHGREHRQAVYAWAESLDLSEEAAEATTDMAEFYREQEAESRRDPLE